MRTSLAMALAFTVLGALPSLAQGNAKGEIAQIAEEAFIYGFPMVMNYAVFYEYFIDKSAPGYKAPLNTLYNSANVCTRRRTQRSLPRTVTRLIRSSAWTFGLSRS
jgi:hypothetical protein